MKNKKLTYFLDVLFIISALIGIYHVYLKPGIPFNLKEFSLEVHDYKPSNSNSIIKEGTIIQSVNGVLIKTQEDLEFILDGLGIGEEIDLGVLNNGILTNTKIVLVRYYDFKYLIIQFLTGGLFVFLAIFVYYKKPEDKAARLYHWAMLGASAIIFTTWGKYSIEPIGLGYYIRFIFSAAYAFSPVLFFHFTLVFPFEREKNLKTILIPLYIFAALLTILMGISFVFATRNSSLTDFNTYRLFFDICRIFAVIWIVLSTFSFIYSYKKAKEEFERRKLRWILLGIVTGPISFIALWVLPQLISSKGLVDEFVILILISALPITFAISIVRYQILDIDYIIARGTVYSIVIGIVFIIYLFLILSLSYLIGSIATTTSTIISTVSAALIAIIFEPLKKRTTRFVDKRFFNVKYNYQKAIDEFSDKMIYCVNENELSNFTINFIKQIIPVERIVFVKISDDKKYIPLGHFELESNEQPDIQSLNDYLLSESNKNLAINKFMEPSISFYTADELVFNKFKIVYSIPIISSENIILGFLLLGRKRSGFRFSKEDSTLLKTICLQFGLELNRILLQEKLFLEKIFSKKLEELNELKSFFVSSVSHDLKTPLTSIKMFAELLLINEDLVYEKKQDFLKIIDGECDRLKRLIDNVLDFSKIEKGIKTYNFSLIDLNQLLIEILKLMEYQISINKFVVETDLSNESLNIFADKDAVEEAIINLLSNSIKYSPINKKILIKTYTKDNYVAVQVKDYGSGISEEDLKIIFQPFKRATGTEINKISGSGLGLTIVKHIMDSHNGNISVESKLSEGTTFTLFFPIIKN